MKIRHLQLENRPNEQPFSAIMSPITHSFASPYSQLPETWPEYSPPNYEIFGPSPIASVPRYHYFVTILLTTLAFETYLHLHSSTFFGGDVQVAQPEWRGVFA